MYNSSHFDGHKRLYICTFKAFKDILNTSLDNFNDHNGSIIPSCRFWKGASEMSQQVILMI